MRPRAIGTILLTLFLIACSKVEDVKPTAFELTPRKVADAKIVEVQEGKYMVSVKLKEEYKKQFEDLTGNNIGKRLAIYHAGNKVLEAIVKDKIASGIIVVEDWSSKGDAERFVDELLPYKSKQ